MAGYQMELETISEMETGDDESQFSNLAINRITEQRELKRSCIE